MVCVACTAEVPDEDVFCENCGERLYPEAPGPPACTCGAPPDEVDEDGFCLRCGRRVRRPANDHIETSLSKDLAGVSDRGLRHDRNEDRFCILQTHAGCVLVVCDGVSATSNAELASAAVSETVARALSEALSAAEVSDPARLVVDAIAAGADALKKDAGSEAALYFRDDSPSTTAVVALVRGPEITLGWVGDSRAYWIDPEGARLLTRDHSWMNTMLESGQMTEEEASAAPQAHAITRWLGADAEGASTPDIVQWRTETSGVLLLCTDGLWNYAPAPERVAELFRGAEEKEALSIARELVLFANEQGGRDNVTVALLRVGAPGNEILSAG